VGFTTTSTAAAAPTKAVSRKFGTTSIGSTITHLAVPLAGRYQSNIILKTSTVLSIPIHHSWKGRQKLSFCFSTRLSTWLSPTSFRFVQLPSLLHNHVFFWREDTHIWFRHFSYYRVGFGSRWRLESDGRNPRVNIVAHCNFLALTLYIWRIVFGWELSISFFCASPIWHCDIWLVCYTCIMLVKFLSFVLCLWAELHSLYEYWVIDSFPKQDRTGYGVYIGW
jgi:hypothetical protein